MTRYLLLIFGIIFFVGCKEKPKSNVEENLVSAVDFEENLYRPNFHFTPKANWMNDPNGMFYLNGKYHLYFQYYPEGNVWGPMHWGHATSIDLVTWEEQPIAIYPDSLGYIYSGSCIVDFNNTASFRDSLTIPVIAIYTNGVEDEKEQPQRQSIAFSNDEGMTWTKYENNPIIDENLLAFRDPKVFWHQDSSSWIMSVATTTDNEGIRPDHIRFYSSPDLKSWNYVGEFGHDIGSQDGKWECPDLFPVLVEETNEVKWVLLASINPGGTNGGSSTQYFIGDFDGKTFVLDSIFAKQLAINKAIWLDFGRDNYAGVTWSNIPESDGRKLFIGWMSNWDYAQVVPTTTWRSAMTIPRELKLKRVDGEYILFSRPIKELDKYKNTLLEKENLTIEKEFILVDKTIDVNKSIVEIELSELKEDTYTFILSNSEGDVLEFGINNVEHYYFVDRTQSGNIQFSEKFADKISKAKFENQLKNVSIQMLIDKTSIELFYNLGEIVMTEIFFPNQPMETLKLVTLNNSEMTIEKLEVSEIKLKN